MESVVNIMVIQANNVDNAWKVNSKEGYWKGGKRSTVTGISPLDASRPWNVVAILRVEGNAEYFYITIDGVRHSIIFGNESGNVSFTGPLFKPLIEKKEDRSFNHQQKIFNFSVEYRPRHKTLAFVVSAQKYRVSFSDTPKFGEYGLATGAFGKMLLYKFLVKDEVDKDNGNGRAVPDGCEVDDADVVVDQRGLFGDIISVGGPIVMDLAKQLLGGRALSIDNSEDVLADIIQVGGSVSADLATQLPGAGVTVHQRNAMQVNAATELYSIGGPATVYSASRIIDGKLEQRELENAMGDILKTGGVRSLEVVSRISGQRGFFQDFAKGFVGTFVPGVEGLVSGFASGGLPGAIIGGLGGAVNGAVNTISNATRDISADGSERESLTPLQQGILSRFYTTEKGEQAVRLANELLHVRDVEVQSNYIRQISELLPESERPLVRQFVQEINRSSSRNIGLPNCPLKVYSRFPEKISELDLTEEQRLILGDMIKVGKNGAIAAGATARMFAIKDSTPEQRREALATVAALENDELLTLATKAEQLAQRSGDASRDVSSRKVKETILAASKRYGSKVLPLVNKLETTTSYDERRDALREIFESSQRDPVVLQVASRLIPDVAQRELAVHELLGGGNERGIFGSILGTLIPF